MFMIERSALRTNFTPRKLLKHEGAH